MRELMRRVPHGVAVVTVDLAGERLGLTVDSLVSLSLEPPLVGVAISRHAAMHELLHDAGVFGVSLLAGGQSAVAQHFARGVPPIALWDRIELRPGDGPPLLAGAIGWLRAAVVAEYPAGDHTLFVGEVDWTEAGDPGPPLVHVGGKYHAL